MLEICTCLCCSSAEADKLLSLANHVHDWGGRIVIPRIRLTPEDLNRIVLALDLERHPGILLKALIEEWDLDTIIRELRV